MVSITHLLSTSADEQTHQIHQMLTDGLGADFQSTTQCIGPGKDFRHLPMAVLKLRKKSSDIIYAWGIGPLAASVIARQKKIFFSPDRFAGKRTLQWIRVLMTRADVTMICPTFTQQRLAISHGIDPDRCQVIQPGVDFGRVRRRRDAELRARLGFSDTDIVVLAPGVSDTFTDHKQAVWTCGILNVLDPSYKLLVWGRGPRATSLSHLTGRLKQPDLITLAEQELGHRVQSEALLGVADLCLITSPGAAPTLPVAMAMAAGVPIVSGVTYMLAELLEDRHTALMVPARSPRALVQRVLDLRADETLQAKLVDTARAEAYEHFSMTKMLEAYRQAFTGEANVQRPTFNAQHRTSENV